MNTKIFKQPFDNNLINHCVNEIEKGSIGVLPTDTVYGIGCDCFNINAIQKLYSIKNRKLNKPINILVSNINMINKVVKRVNPIEKKLIEHFWPGALTIIFDKSDVVPDVLTAGLNTIGIRMPNNKLCLEIINKLKNPIAMSSANISDNDPDETLDNLLLDFNSKVNFIVYDKYSKYKVPSTIVRVENDEILILREGSITKNDILKCFGGNINVR